MTGPGRMSSWPVTEGVFELGDTEVERGGVIRDARLVWQAHGTLNAARDNVIVYPCSYTATHEDLAELIGPDLVLDPEKWFIVVPDMFSNGLSSSAADDPDFPAVVTAGTTSEPSAACSRSSGASTGSPRRTASRWARSRPTTGPRCSPTSSSARSWSAGARGLRPTTRSSSPGCCGSWRPPPSISAGAGSRASRSAALRAFGHVYAGWGLSQDFYREELFRTVLGAPDLETYLRTDWEAGFASSRAANLYAQAVTWSEADISGGGELSAALAAIRARVLLMPSETDLYFRVADNAAELPHLASAELLPIPSIWGHRAGSPAGLPAELAFVRTAVQRWLET